VVLQLVSAAAYAPGLASLLRADVAAESRLVRLGAVVLLVGAMGSAADAVFHLVAFEMTAPGLAGPALEIVMRRLQGPGLALLLPFVAAFFAGHVLLVLGLRRRGLVGPLAPWLLAAAPVAAGIGALVARAGAGGARAAGLTALGCVSGSLVVAGARLWRPGPA
jgi:hypothetical protein